MKTRYITALLVSLVFCGSIYAQTYRVESTGASALTAQQKATLSQTVNNPVANRSSANNAVFIQQVGFNNNAISNTRSVASSVNLFQRGANNDISVNVSAGLVSENVFQTGFNNKFIDLNPSNNRTHQATVFQRGSNQNLIWMGSNSISEKLSINMQGNSGKTIIVRNFKR